MPLLPFRRNDRHRDGSVPLTQSAAGHGMNGADSHSEPNAAAESVPVAATPLTLKQALTITAGLAGLVGLLSGSLIRFSLANSTNARFLSPLQTFPTLADWPSAESSEATTDRVLEGQPPEPTKVFVGEEELGEEELEPLDAPDWEEAPLEEDPGTEYWQEDLPETDPWAEDDDQNRELNWQTNEDFDTFNSEGFTRMPQSKTVSSRDRTPSTFDDFASRSLERSTLNQEDPLKALSKGPLLR